jgi:rubredoxin
MGLHTEFKCKECGWTGHSSWENPETVYLVVPAIVFFLLYRFTDFDFDKAIAGESVLQINILIYMIVMIVIPLFHITKTLFLNLKTNKGTPDKCPECGFEKLEISGGFS